MSKGKIIFFNGVSSTGKSTLSRIIQKKLDEPYHWLNVDNFMSFTDMSHHPSTYFEKGKDPVSVFPHVVKLYSDLGINVIVDVAFMKWQGPRLFLAEETMKKCLDLLHDYPVLYAHITCPYHELERRHRERGDRGKGRALNLEYKEDELVGDTNSIYDLIINTHTETNEEIVNRIIKSVSTIEKMSAFKKLWLLLN